MKSKITIQNLTRRFCGFFLAAVGLALTILPAAGATYQSVVLGDNPLAFYALNPGSDPSGVSPDLTEHGNDGFANAITPATGPSAYITNAANFVSGNTSYIDISQGSDPSLLIFAGPITLEAWVQPISTTEFEDIFAQGYENASGYPEITLRANGSYGGGYVGGSENSNFSVYINGGTQTTNWTHVVVSMDGTNCSIYVNGALAGRTADAYGSTIFPSPDDWVIGSGSDQGFGRLFDGNISEVAMYNYGLTAKQVAAHFNMGMYGSTNPPPGPSLRWSANNNSGVWDTGTSTNWVVISNSQPSVFNGNDPVLFDDTIGVPTNVTVSGTDLPYSITVNSSTNDFTFGGSGNISGSSSLLKEGSSLLTIDTPSGITGPVTILGGAIYAGNNCLSLVSSIDITNASTLDLAGGTFSGGTPVTVSGTGLNGEGALYNSYADYPQEVLNITLAGNAMFGGSARWDMASGAQINGPYDLTVDWSGGAGYCQWNNITIGASVPQISVTNGSSLGFTGMDSSCQNPATLFSIASGCQLIFYSGGFNGSIGTAGSVTIYNGTFGGSTITVLNGGVIAVYNAGTTFSTGTVHVSTGGTFYLYSTNINFTGSNLIFDNNSQWVTYYNSGSNVIGNAVTLNGVVHCIIGNHNMIYTNVISGTGGFVEDYYDSDMVLSASNTYMGPTIIGDNGNNPEVALTGNGSISQSSLIFFGGTNATAGRIDVSGRVDHTLTLASGQTLAGIGGINGSLVVSPGAILSPSGTNTTIGITTGANSTGAIAASGAVALNGTTVLKLNGSGVNDEVEAGAGITYGGTLSLVNISGSSLAAGNSFQIFNATSYTGSFSSITPATPGPGLAWDTSQLNIGFLNVAAGPSQPSISSVSESGNNLIINGTNGTSGGTYYVLATTNLTIPLANWVKLSTNTYNANGSFSVTNMISPGTPQQFYSIETQ